MGQINKYSFIRWYDASTAPTLPADLPHAYWLDRARCGYAPIAVAGEVLSFYINTENGVNISGFSDLRLSLVRVDNGAVVNANVATLQQQFLNSPTNTVYNIWANVTLPVMGNGYHYFRIYRNTGGAEVLRSGYILARTDTANIFNQTTYVKFRQDRFFYHVRYGGIPGFYQQYRLNLSVLESQVESDKEAYKEVTTGKQRTFNNTLSQYHVVEAYYFDKQSHEAAALMVQHDELYLNGKKYSLKAAYKSDPNERTKLTKGTCELWDDEFSSANFC